MTLSCLAPAKINLTLDITGRAANGYHFLKTLYLPVSLYDRLEFELTNDSRVTLQTDSAEVPDDRTNLVYQAAELLRRRFSSKPGAAIKLTKNIPVAAGLGGGSSDAAATLLALNQLWSLRLSQSELIALAAELGMDVPLFIHGAGVIFGAGFGEQINPVGSFLQLSIVLVKPEFNISTKEAYADLDLNQTGQRLDSTTELIAQIQTQNDFNADLIHNDFEFSIFKKYPELKDLKEKMLHHGALTAGLSGSGPTIFSLWANPDQAEKYIQQAHRSDIFLVQPLNAPQFSFSPEVKR